MDRCMCFLKVIHKGNWFSVEIIFYLAEFRYSRFVHNQFFPRSLTFSKTFWNFCADFCPPSPKVWNFFSVAIFEFSPAPTPPDQWCGYTPGGIFSNPPLASPHHWTGGAGSQKRSRKSFKLLATAERSVGQKSTQIFHFLNPFKKCENWNWKCVIWILDARYRPDPDAPLAAVLRWDTAPRGGHERCCANLPDEDCSGPPASSLAGDTALRWLSL